METSGDQQDKICPYFSKEMKACGLSKDGIYLPPKVHVLTYCLSSMYETCSIYRRVCPLDTEQRHAANQDQGQRRCFNRIREHKKVLIRTSSPQGVVVGDFAEMAMTLDYSQGGMRVALDRELPGDSLFLFDFDDDFLIPRLQGFAQLRWYRKIEEGGHEVEAGLVFRDKYSQRAIALALEDVNQQ